MGLLDSGINTAEALDDSETEIDCDLDPTAAIAVGVVVQLNDGTTEKMVVSARDAGGSVLADMGSASIDRSAASFFLSGYTLVDKSNPANVATTLTRIQFYARQTFATSIKVGAFYTNGGNLKCRSVATITAPQAGQNTYVVTLAVQIGDFIGFYFPSEVGDIEVDLSGGAVYYNNAGSDLCTVNAEGTFTAYGNRAMSLFAYSLSTPNITVTRGDSPVSHDTGKDIMLYTPSKGGIIPKLIAAGII